MRRYLWLVIVCAIVVIVVVLQWRQNSKPQSVKTVIVKVMPLVAEWSAVGYVESRSARVTAPQIGRVEKVLVHEGDPVRAGQTLAILSRRTETAIVDSQSAGILMANAQAEASRSTKHETELSQAQREKRVTADTAVARERWRQAIAVLERDRRTLPAHIDAARAELDASRAALRDLERGSRPEEIAQADSEVRSAESTLRRTRLEIERQQRLFKEGAIAKRELESAQESVERAESALASRREALKLLKQGTRDEQITGAKAKVRTAEAQLRVAEADLAGLAVEERKVEEAIAALHSAKAAEAEARSGRIRLDVLSHQARAAQSAVQQSRAAFEQATSGLSERTVIAPFSGIVGRRSVDPGDMASPTQPLFTIVETDRTWISAEVDEQDLAPVFVGQEVSVTAPAYVGREFRGRVTRIGGEAVPQTEVRTGARIVRVLVSLNPTPPEQRLLLKPGMEIHASGKSTLSKSSLLVPSDSIMTDSEGAYVWLIADRRSTRRRVKPGYVTGPTTEVVAGLSAGQEIVVTGKEGLKEGQIVTTQSESKPE